MPGATTDNNDLLFWVRGRDGSYYSVDLREFHEGRSISDLPSRHRNQWGGDFSGRPAIARELAEYFRNELPPKASERSKRASARILLRCLDHIDPQHTIQSIADLRDAHGVQLMSFILTSGPGAGPYKSVKILVDALRGYAAAPVLFWPTPSRGQIAHEEELDLKALGRLYNALKKEALQIKAMFREGELLVSQGCDPRSRWGNKKGAWEERENHAWLVHHLTKETLITKQQFYRAAARGLNKANNPSTQKHDGPSYLAPGMTERGHQGIVGKLRWFHPSYHDTAIFFLIFLLKIEWSLAPCVVVDVSLPAEKELNRGVSPEIKWMLPQPGSEELCTIFSRKDRTGEIVTGVSGMIAAWSPYQIIKFMIERTAPLRRTVLKRLIDARHRYKNSPYPELEEEIARLERMSRSPWLYHVVNEVGEIGFLESQDSQHLNAIARAVAQKHGLNLDHPQLAKFVTGLSRDAVLEHMYTTTMSPTVARLAADHKDFRSLRNYIRRHRYRRHSEKKVRALQDAVFAEIAEGRDLDKTRVRLLIERGKITEKQAARLLDHRHRTRVGMGCLEPDSPPKHISPDHISGTLCRVQRCTGCEHGVIFDDSLDPLAKSRAELFYIQSTIPLAVWMNSSFEEEAQSLDETLTHFDPDKVRDRISFWLVQFRSGVLIAAGTFPAYK